MRWCDSVRQQVSCSLSQGTFLSIVSVVDDLLDKKTILTETSDEIRTLGHFQSSREWKQLKDPLDTLWRASKITKGLFELNLIIRREQIQEVVHLYEDCSSDRKDEILEEPWENCASCSQFLNTLEQLHSSRDYQSAPRIVVDFVSHLASCSARSASVQLEVVVKKKTLAEVARTETSEPQGIKLSVWYDLKNFQSWLSSLSPWDFFHNYGQETDSAYGVLVHRSYGAALIRSGAFLIIPTSSMTILSDPTETAVRADDMKRIRLEAEGLAREIVLKDLPYVPPRMLLARRTEYQPDDTFLESLSRVLAYSIFCVVCDSARPVKEFTEFTNSLPFGAQSVRLSFASDADDLVIHMDGNEDLKIRKSDWMQKVVQIYSTFCEHPGAEGYGALRKTAVSELLKLGKFANVVNLVLETDSLLAYYKTVRDQLLERRIDQLAAVIEKISDSAAKSSISLSEMIESMQHDITNVSMLLLGALLVQVYSYISKALSAKQLFLLLTVFGVTSSLFLLLLDFRLSDIEDSGKFIKQAFNSLERSLFQQTGISIVAWGEFVNNSYKSLVKRIEIVDTLTWGSIALDILGTYYFLFNLTYYGYAWWLALALGVSTAVAFVLVFFTVRRTKSGFDRVRGRSTVGTLLILLTLATVCAGSALLTIGYLSRIL
jgi:hypothetical protein